MGHALKSNCHQSSIVAPVEQLKKRRKKQVAIRWEDRHEDIQRKSRSARKRGLVMFTALTCAVLGLTPGTSLEQTTPEDWKVDPIRGPVDMGLTDPSLIGAIDVHLHVDPDAPGTGGVIRAIDVFDA